METPVNKVWGLLSVVSRQPSGVTAQLVAAKGRLAKRDLTIPRLELIGAHMASNLLANVKAAWLTNHDLWPPNPVLQPSPESEAELKPIRRVLRLVFEPSVRELLERILETIQSARPFVLVLGSGVLPIFSGDPLTACRTINHPGVAE